MTASSAPESKSAAEALAVVEEPQTLFEIVRRWPPRQWLKVVVYSLLLVNFVQYVVNDITVMRHAVHDGWRWIDWTSAFATTMDESAWFVLLLLFELETYLLSDEAFTHARVRLMQAVRIVCYLFLAHTVYAFSDVTWKLYADFEQVDAPLCGLVDQELSFARNLNYTELDQENCTSLASGSTFYLFEQRQLVTDPRGFQIERELAWADLVEVLVWLIIVLLLELMVRLQDRGIAEGRVLRSARSGAFILYGVLWSIAAYWAYRGHWIFTWDEALWILGFAAIGMNLDEWRDELRTARESNSELERSDDGVQGA